ncbi:hypothetical protein EI94DRAFT_1704705 [Lactarius quietus]|nr:hypothetical protein EI94DRAFT_1704705 [Lactarius quietus]
MPHRVLRLARGKKPEQAEQLSAQARILPAVGIPCRDIQGTRVHVLGLVLKYGISRLVSGGHVATMAHYDIFREQLAIRFPGYGHALWEPSPGGLYHVGGVGDVGYVSQGRFHRLFNILLPANDPSHANFGVPDGHEPFTPNVSITSYLAYFVPNTFARPESPWRPMSITGNLPQGWQNVQFRPRDPGEVSFSCRGKQGAILSLPIQATRENTVMSKEFGKWMIQHIALWFAWARDKGLEIDRMERYRSHARVSFGVEVANSRINWQFSPERKTGAVWNWRPNGRLRAAAGPNPDPKDSDGEPDSDVELISIPAVPKYHDPLHVILEYIAEERPHCDTVIVHDDDLALLDVLGDGTSLEGLEPDVVMRCLRSSKPVLHEVVLGKTTTVQVMIQKSLGWLRFRPPLKGSLYAMRQFREFPIWKVLVII